MTAGIREVISHLIMVVMVSGMIELLLPEGTTQPFVRLVMGLAVLSACLEPILVLFSG